MHSGPDVQKLAATSVEDQKRLLSRVSADRCFVSERLVALAGIGARGRHLGNAHRDLCLILGEPSVPKPFRASVHQKVVKPRRGQQQTQFAPCSMLLPHELFHRFYTDRHPEFVVQFLGGHEAKVEEFWRGVIERKDPRIVYHPMATERPDDWMRRGLPISFHGDAVPCLRVGHAGTKSLDVTSWQATLACEGSSLTLKHYIYSMFTHSKLKNPMVILSTPMRSAVKSCTGRFMHCIKANGLLMIIVVLNMNLNPLKGNLQGNLWQEATLVSYG